MNGKYILNIDWLALYGTQSLPLRLRPDDRPRSVHDEEADEIWQNACAEGADEVTPLEAAERLKRWHLGEIELVLLPYGSKQFSAIVEIYYMRDLFGLVQLYPKLPSLPKSAMIFKIANPWLYRSEWMQKFEYICAVLRIMPISISRLDLAADFNTFWGGLHPVEFIRRFMSGEIKHKGRGVGHVDFVQRYARDAKEKAIRDSLHFNALTMGKKTSDAHCYLYNKTIELDEVKNKPYIRDCWRAAGFDIKDVWRLEVTMGAKALKFMDKKTGEPYKFGLKDILHPGDSMNIAILYRSMLHSLFFFFYPTGKKNVSREEEIQLFEDECLIDRGVIRESQVSNRSERILIKQLFTLSQRYTGITETDQKAAVRAANNLVRACDLQEWYDNHKTEWTYVRRKN